MLTKIKPIFKGYYDPVKKIWNGGKWHRHYDKDCSMGRILYEEMRRRPKQICQISDSEQTQLTNEEVLQQAFCIAKYFQSLQLKQSDIIGLVCRNTTYVISVLLASFFSGIAPHSVSPNHDEKTTRHLFQITKPKLIFCDGQDYTKIRSATSDLNCKIVTLKQRVPNVPIVTDILDANEVETEFEPAELENGRDQTLLIMCSSGTTGMPKAVTMSNTTRAFEFGSFLNSSCVVYVSSNFDWVTGIIILLSSIINGAKMIITEKPYAPEYFLEIIEKYGVTFTLLSRCNMVMLVKSPKLSADKLSSLKYFIYGGGKLSPTILNELQSYLPNGNIITVYSFTEFGNPLTWNPNLDNPTSAGRLKPGFQLKIIDEAGQHLGPGEVGEICCSHGEHWQGYFNNEEATAALFDSERWYHTADIGYMDEHMYLYIVDRKRDILKYRSMQYWPSEIENVIEELPDVVDVCVFGVDNELDGDAAAAAVVITENSALTEQNIVNYVAEKFEVKYKHLNAGAIILNDLPKNNNGKINRKALLEIYSKLKGCATI